MKPNQRYRSFSFLTFLIVGLAAIIVPGPAYGVPDLGVRFSASSFNSISSLPDLAPGLQPGLMTEVVLDIAAFDVFSKATETDRPRPAFLADIGVQAFWFKASSPSADGNLYRAWRGFSTIVLAGARFPAFPFSFLNASGAFHALGGASLMATKYTGTGLLSANPALALRIGMDVSFGGNLRWGLELPIEVAFKSGGVATVFGISGVVTLDQWKKVQ